MHDKKAQGLPINVIIIAVIGLVILIVIIAIITNKTALFVKSTGGSCQDRGGTCLYESGKETCSEIDGKPLRVIAAGCQSIKGEAKIESGPCCLPLNE